MHERSAACKSVIVLKEVTIDARSLGFEFSGIQNILVRACSIAYLKIINALMLLHLLDAAEPS